MELVRSVVGYLANLCPVPASQLSYSLRGGGSAATAADKDIVPARSPDISFRNPFLSLQMAEAGTDFSEMTPDATSSEMDPRRKSTLETLTAEEFKAELAARGAPAPPQQDIILPAHIADLNTMCQQHSLPKPEYEYQQRGSSGQGTFDASVRLSLPKTLGSFLAAAVESVEGYEQDVIELQSWPDNRDVLIVKDQGFSTKKVGKQTVAEKAFALLKAATDLECASLAVADAPVDEADQSVPVPVQDENYVGLLEEFANATRNPHPAYTDYRPGQQRFSCTVQLTINLPSTDQLAQDLSADAKAPLKKTLLFGSAGKPFGSKRAAKSAAAREAVLHLRERGLLRGPGAGPMRKLKRQNDAVPSDRELFSSSPIAGLTRSLRAESTSSENSGGGIKVLGNPLLFKSQIRLPERSRSEGGK